MQASWHFTCFHIHWDGSLVSSKEIVPEYYPAFLPLSSLEGLIPWDSTTQIFKEAKFCSLEVQDWELSFASSCPQDPELHRLMISAAQAAFDLHIPSEPVFLGKCEVLQITSPHWLWHLCQKLPSVRSRSLLEFCLSAFCCQSPLTSLEEKLCFSVALLAGVD